MQSINEIKEILKNTDVTALSEFIKHYNTDERSGVKKLVLKAEKEIEAYNKEVARTENLKFFENSDCRGRRPTAMGYQPELARWKIKKAQLSVDKSAYCT